MKRLLILVPLFCSATLNAQLPQIRVTGVYPAGGQQGQSVDVTVTAGTDLDDAAELIFSHPGLKAVPKKDGNGNPIASQFTVSVGSDVAAGLYDVRVRGLFGISNPRIFRVDTLPEVAETEPNNAPEQAQEVAINTIVNARSNGAADVDLYRISVDVNQTIVCRSEAAAIDSVMQPVLELFDAAGRRVGNARRRRQKDAVVVFTSPEKQTMTLKVHDMVYAGSNDYGYRLAVDTRPVVDAVYPQIVQPGVEQTITIVGRHVPGGTPSEGSLDGIPLLAKDMTVKLAPSRQMTGTDSTAAGIDAVVYGGIEGNLLQFAVQNDAIPSVRSVASSDKPQTVSPPVSVSGSFGTELEEDVFRFQAKKGELWHIDVLANRLGSGADPMLIVEQVTTAADGIESMKRLVRAEEGTINPGGTVLPTLTSDPAFVLNTPDDGTYQVRLADRFAASRGAADLTWTVVIRRQTPDFRVVVFDSLASTDGKVPPGAGAVSLRKGGTYQVPVYAYRSGGHNEEIILTVEGLPEGVSCASAKIPAGSSTASLVFSAAADCSEVTAPVRVLCSSNIGGQPVQTPAKVATLVHDGVNGLARTARVSGSILVSVMRDEEPFYLQPAIASAEVSQDQQLLIPLKLSRRAGFDNKVDVAFTGQPGNVDVPKVAIEKGTDTFLARLFFKENAATGPATLTLYTTGQVPYRRKPWLVDEANRKVAAANQKLETANKALADSKAAAEAGARKVTELATMLKTLEQQLVAEQTGVTTVQQTLKAAVAKKAEASKQLLALEQKLAAAAASQQSGGDELDAAIKAVEAANAAVAEARKPVESLTAELKTLTAQVVEKQKVVAAKTKQVADAKAAMTAQQQAVEKAMAAVKTAETNLKAGEAEKKAAEAAVKQATDASKPQNKNYRAVAVPVNLVVHTTPGKIAAAVPNGGAIKKGTSAQVKVTLTRKNNFAGPVKVSLSLPEGATAVTSDTIEIAADQTEGMLTLTAAGDAAAADIAHAVIRATAEFNGRQASFDAPIALKVTE